MDLKDLYQDVILQHARRPHHYGPVEGATVTVRGDNPMCGDEVEVQLRVVGDRVEAVGFTGQACAICTASASVMTDVVTGQSKEACLAHLRNFEAMIAPGESEAGSLLPLAARAFQGVKQFPQRVKCAMLPWRVLERGLGTD